MCEHACVCVCVCACMCVCACACVCVYVCVSVTPQDSSYKVEQYPALDVKEECCGSIYSPHVSLVCQGVHSSCSCVVSPNQLSSQYSVISANVIVNFCDLVSC